MKIFLYFHQSYKLLITVNYFPYHVGLCDNACWVSNVYKSELEMRVIKALCHVTRLSKWLEFHREITTVEFLIDNLNDFSHS